MYANYKECVAIVWFGFPKCVKMSIADSVYYNKFCIVDMLHNDRNTFFKFDTKIYVHVLRKWYYVEINK